MAEYVEFAIGDSFAQRHEQFRDDLGDEYDEQMRNLIENELHTITQQLERQAEQQLQLGTEDNPHSVADVEDVVGSE